MQLQPTIQQSSNGSFQQVTPILVPSTPTFYKVAYVVHIKGGYVISNDSNPIVVRDVSNVNFTSTGLTPTIINNTNQQNNFITSNNQGINGNPLSTVYLDPDFDRQALIHYDVITLEVGKTHSICISRDFGLINFTVNNGFTAYLSLKILEEESGKITTTPYNVLTCGTVHYVLSNGEDDIYGGFTVVE